MSPSPPVVPTRAPWRSILLPASFAGGGMLLAGLLLVLIGCSSFGSLPGEVSDPVKNAVLCDCECDPPSGAIAVPWQNSIFAGEDDATQGNLGGNQIVLGQNTVGFRFRQLGVPRFATITSAKITFTAAAVSPGGTTTLPIFVVDQPDAQLFGPLVDLDSLPLAPVRVDWPTGQWAKVGDAEVTADLSSLVQAIVSKKEYTPNNAVAFIIKPASATRTAAAFESNNLDPAFLHVDYVPHKSAQEFVTCASPADTADPAKAAAFCQVTVQNTVSNLAQQCRLANSCKCKLRDADATQFSAVCKPQPGSASPCEPKAAPQDCDPSGLEVATHAQGDTPVCVANSPLGSLLTGRMSACDLDEASSNVTVQVRDEKGNDQHTASNTARGRVQFVGTPCPGGSCDIGMNHRINVNELAFSDALEGHTLADVTGVGENAVGSFVNIKNTGVGTFGSNETNHSVRGTDINEDEGGTKGFFRGNADVLTISVGGWTPGAVCSMAGTLINETQVTLTANLQGRLVNQPPKAMAGDDQTGDKAVECNQPGGATFNLDGSQSSDPDNNIVSFVWLKGSRTGELIGNLPRAQFTQLVSTPTSNHQTAYVFKVIDEFGQYDQDTTQVNVVDTTPPTVHPPGNIPKPGDKPIECTGVFTQVEIGTATAEDVCDASPTVASNKDALFPNGFPLGTSTVTWTATTTTAINDAKNKGTATQTITVADTTPPNLTVALSPTVLWPPDHKLIPITATITVSDTCDPNPTVKLLRIESNEPDNGLGDGDTAEDIQGATADARTFMLRAERGGKGNGRIYTVTYQASDASGNTTTKTATVIVPKSQAASN
jgi:hypothetical protein